MFFSDACSPILRDIPEQFETERLIIRVPRAGDGPGLNAAVIETFDELAFWMPWARERPGVEKSEENSRKAYSLFLAREDITLRLIHKESGLFLGSSGLHETGRCRNLRWGTGVAKGLSGRGISRRPCGGFCGLDLRRWERGRLKSGVTL